ncbi:MAG: hypothetical protein PHI15_05935 [Methanomicrobium sp.]|nr:hypothetical protein [Methanomicrobium sp.]
MGFQSLHKALLLLRHPVMWLSGVFSGLFCASLVYLAFLGTAGAFYAERLLVFGLLMLPFFLAATYGSIKGEDYSFKNYLKEGISGYFRVLLPTVIITAVFFVFILVLALPGTMSGASGMLLMSVSFIVILIPVLLFVFFYDTAAIFEDKKVFECIRRSFEVSYSRTVQIFGFYLLTVLILFILFTGFSLLWSGILASQFEPLLSMSEEEINNFATNPDAVREMLGEYGVLITAVMTFFGAFVFTVFFLPYKAVFYRDHLKDSKITPVSKEPLGEYDEKGRWYKY